MTDGPDRVRKGQRSEAAGPLESLASEALRVLAEQRAAGPAVMSGDVVTFLRSSVLKMDVRSSDMISGLRERDVSDEDIIDIYIPEVARRLGEDWIADRLGFADVTIGSSRLQSMLRELVLTQEADDYTTRSAGVAIMVLASEFHTLGAMVLATQLRRMGVSARLFLGVSVDHGAEELRTERFDAVFVSGSSFKLLAELKTFIKKLRLETGGKVPIVVGGPIVDLNDNVKTVVGADFATTDPVEALRLCQLKTSRIDASVKKTVTSVVRVRSKAEGDRP